jgi:hypothetical protein
MYRIPSIDRIRELKGEIAALVKLIPYIEQILVGVKLPSKPTCAGASGYWK